MEFEVKQVTRAIRDLEVIINSLYAAGVQVYKTRLQDLIRLIEKNEILNEVVAPYLTLEIDTNEIERGYDWIDLRLPEEEDLQIAYALQTVKKTVEGELNFDDYTLRIFRQKKNLDNIIAWNSQILMPAIQVLLNKLNDMIEDEVVGKESIKSESLQVINYGEIHANSSNVAFGLRNTQSIVMESMSEKIIERALTEGLIEDLEKDKVKDLTEDIEKELQVKKPSTTRLQEIAQKLFEVGSKGLLTLTAEIIKSNSWSQAVIKFISDKI